MNPLRCGPLLLLLTACASTPSVNPPPSQEEFVLAKDVRVRRMAPGVWMHVTEAGGDWAGITANGLLVEDGDASILVDTGWTPEHAQALLTWARDTLHHPVRAAVVTHFHLDRTGGIPTLDAQGIPVHAREDTALRAGKQGNPVPSKRLADAQDFGPLSVFFPGAGHSPDNLVVMHPASGILYGGCFIKDAHAKTLGNLEDADIAAWPASIQREREHFPNARIVIPGHEQPGGPELLDHTEALLKKTSR
ncbi:MULTISPECIES: COR family subclass B1 metallo-beta-lactamase [unclassified Corallococcus]|uniref:COR family subclass B1 metallo-beta-lactamase n=1 Tax=unclassified Corallococcus TaxID=2685029 RepID=UPI001A8D2465|nr:MULTISPECIES: subclass B1 metallo-beta-lactamase [unclassified Corallococcus]MBN9682461.1 subclass B1 metallo-beta-lactamase [Corallococcus sp. NCSPR001]WAS85986.1 subclass B1 metallo-beta-lactamase [Corallococcus sp. NCRR]